MTGTDSWEDRAQRIINGVTHDGIKTQLQKLAVNGKPQTVVVYNALVGFHDEHGFPPTLRELQDLVGLFHTGLGRYHMSPLENAGLIKVARSEQRVSHRGWHPVKPKDFEAPEEDTPPERQDDRDVFGTDEGPTVFLVDGPVIQEVR